VTIKQAAALCFIVGLTAATPFAQDRVRELFEWGEYDSLLTIVGRTGVTRFQNSESAWPCRYDAYSGVACFAKGDIAEARRRFEIGLNCDSSLTLDTQYVTPEMLNLFSATKTELEEQRLSNHKQDSLRAAKEVELAAMEAKKRQAAAVRLTYRKHVAGTAAGISISLVMGWLATHEYLLGKEYNRSFNEAATMGDKATYDRYQGLLKRTNRYIIGSAAASAAGGCLGAYFAYRSMKLSRMHLTIETSGEGYGVVVAATF
jgi:hypothetical protein